MIKKMNIRGQTALILILLTAAALVFLAITLNWGRIAQTKALITVAADQSASALASNAASYGEMQKQTYLQNTNKLTETTSILLAIIMIVIAVIITILCWGTCAGVTAGIVLHSILVASIVMSVTNLALQLAVVQPGITSMWNKLQKNQPIPQQFYEEGISTALQGAVGDQVNITDYFDWNANGIYGSANNLPNDIVGRFAVFYNDRLKMLNQPPNPSVLFFYNQLSELMNGESCDQNETDYASDPGSVVLNPACTKINASDTYCINNPTDPACEEEIPNVFQLNDTCADSNPASPTYNPYCDPCCQILNKPNSLNAGNPIPVRPSSCDQSAAPAQCQTNNPFGASYPLLYDPTFQNYPAGKSFLAQFGRDQQMAPFTTLTPEVMTPATATPSLEFPNGVYPYFWLMDNYSPEVDNIDPTTTPLTASQDHWCTTAVAPAVATPAGFTDLAQLSLPYTCQLQDCCVNHLLNSLTSNGSVNSSAITITLINGPVVNITSPANGSYFATGANVTFSATASEAGGTIQTISLYIGNSLAQQCASSPCSTTAAAPAAGSYSIYATALDANGNSAQSSTIAINVVDPPTVSITVPGTLTAGSSVSLTATASTSAPGDSISSVAYYNGAALIASTTTGPSYSVSWTVPASGTKYNLTAVATDAYGITATSTVVTGTVP